MVAFKGARDLVFFSDKRFIAVNVQGITSRKRDYTTLPYSKMQVFPVEMAGTFIRMPSSICGSAAWGKVRLEFKGDIDILPLPQLIATHVQ